MSDRPESISLREWRASQRPDPPLPPGFSQLSLLTPEGDTR